MRDVRTDLVERLIDQCRVLSVTGEEAPLATAIAAHYHRLGLPVRRVGDSLVVGEPLDDRATVLLVGHLDVVAPTEADREPRLERHEDGEVVVGRGASDMKAGNVVAMALLEDPDLRVRSPFAPVLVLYAGEEGPAEGNELEDVLAGVGWLADAGLAVVLEPTDGEVHLGCLGGLHAELTFRGRQAHSARPWHGENAMTKAGALLDELHRRPPTVVTVDGIVYRDVWSATRAWTDNPRNAIPGTFVVNLNLRFAPDRGLDDAEAELRAWVDGRADVEIVDRAPPAPPHRDDPMVDRFVAAVGATVAGKQAWTDVARLAAVGVPALNYGPGATAQAHQEGEHVRVNALVDAHRRLHRFLLGTGGGGSSPGR